MFAVNVFGVQNSYAAAARQMIKQGNCTAEAPGKIVGVSFTSILAKSQLSATVVRLPESANIEIV